MKAPGEHYDIVIAGGGMIGSCLALALQPLNLRVAVIEPVPASAETQPSFDDRTTALSRSSKRMFEAMGLWDQILPATTPIRHIHVSDKGRFGFSHIDAEEQGVEALGYVVINRTLGSVLAKAREDAKVLDWMCPASVTATDVHGDKRLVTVETADGPVELSCSLLVAADGARSKVRDMAGISARHVSYDQKAIVGNLMSQKPLDNRAFERFTSEGPLALLPMADERAAFIWTLSEANADAMLALPDEQFVERLQADFGTRLGSFDRVGKRAAYPLVLSKAHGLFAQRAVMVGNAAHGLHPVAAQGYNLGMRDIASLCDCLFDNQTELGAAFDPGADELLQQYAEWRKPDQGKLVDFTDGLVRLFGDARGPVKLLRNVGMLAFDIIPGVRNTFARHTMGLAGRLPRLSRGLPLQ